MANKKIIRIDDLLNNTQFIVELCKDQDSIYGASLYDVVSPWLREASELLDELSFEVEEKDG